MPSSQTEVRPAVPVSTAARAATPVRPVGLPAGVRRGLQSATGLAVLVLVFELLRASGLLPATSVPSTGTVLGALAQAVADGQMLGALGWTVLAWVLGLLVAAAAGIPLGIAVGLSRWADSASRSVVEILRPVPAVALVPVAIVLFGIQVPMQVFLVAIACVWPLLLGARGGVRAVDPLQVDTARSFGLGPVAAVRRVVWPAALPAVMTSLRLSASLGIVVAVGAQLISGSPGLGSLLVNSQNAGNNDVVWACLLVTGAFGVLVNRVLARAETALAGWQALSTEGRR